MSKRPASIREIRANSGSSFGVMLGQLLPPSRGDVGAPVVGAGPDGPDILIGGRDGEDRGVHFGAVHVVGDRPARWAERLRIGPGEIARDPLPGLSLVGRLPEVL